MHKKEPTQPQPEPNCFSSPWEIDLWQSGFLSEQSRPGRLSFHEASTLFISSWVPTFSRKIMESGKSHFLSWKLAFCHYSFVVRRSETWPLKNGLAGCSKSNKSGHRCLRKQIPWPPHSALCKRQRCDPNKEHTPNNLHKQNITEQDPWTNLKQMQGKNTQ